MFRPLCAALLCALPSLAQAHGDRYEPITEGSLRVVQPGGQVAPMPLRHTDVQAEVSGFVARVKVEQTFENPFSRPIEAIYVFPLPDRGGVDSMTLTVGDRVVKGAIKKRQEARALYEQAKSRGQTAALLDQERPNIFTQSVANIAPGNAIRVALTYVAPLEYDHGEYTFNFPMVVGPRYIPGGALVGENQGRGWANDTDRVDDASRITPPVLGAGQRSGHDISLTVRLDAGVALHDIRSVSHDVTITRSGQREARVELKPSDAIPNKDFVLRYQVAGEQMQAGILTHRDERGGFFTLMIQPQAELRPAEVMPKELYFVIDQSCSQTGLPMEKEKGIVNEALDRMNSADTFQIMTFNNGVHFFAGAPMANTPQNVRRARAFVNGLTANGGTEMLGGVLACLNAPRDLERLRFVMFLTDGYVGNDNEIIHAVQSHVGSTRLYTYGVGSSVNHYLLDRMAEVGRGYTQYARPDEDTRKSVALFYERIAKPYLVDVSVDFADLGVTEVYPKVIRDLFEYQPIILTGRFEGAGGPGTVSLKGKVAGSTRTTKVAVDLPRGMQSDNEALAAMFGRARIEHLAAQQYGGHKAEIVQEMTDTALNFHLMSPYTSFVAIEEHRVAGVDGRPPTVVQAVHAPEGTHFSDANKSDSFGPGPIGNLFGTGAGDVHGVGGLGLRGVGAGGGGAANPNNSFSAQGVGTFASGGGKGGADAVSSPTPPMAHRRSSADKSESLDAPAEPASPPAFAEGMAGKKNARPDPVAATVPGAESMPAGNEQKDLAKTSTKEPMRIASAQPVSSRTAPISSRIEIVDLLIRGPLARGDAQVALRDALTRLTRLSSDWAGATGTLLIRVAVAADGSVSAVEVLQDGVQSPRLITELTQELKSVRLPSRSDETTLTVSLRVH